MMILDEKISQKIMECYERLISEEKLPTKDQLEKYYETFRRLFGPDTLKKLDGEALLNAMHAPGTHDSLDYWLEFKRDEEFETIFFGGIGGGSAFKFGIHRDANGNWKTGAAAKLRAITIDEAIKIAVKQRDQLVQGCEFLDKLSTNGSDSDYKDLRKKMDEYAPDVSNSAWGHKYFSLLYPDKLDDCHVERWQHILLIKLLQTPPQGEGRYIAAGRFVSIAKELNIPVIGY